MAEKQKIDLRFPKNFLWGASISSHQVEGGNHNQWSAWELETAQIKAAQAPYRYKHLSNWDEIKAQATKPQNYVSGQATDHFNRYTLDFDIAKKLNFTALRVGIEWSRVEPTEGKFDQKAITHYRMYLEELTARGITPIITLWHWTFPDWFAQKGGFLKRSNIKYFENYAEYLTQQLGSYFKYVITLNEPTVYTAYSYHEHLWPPQMSSKVATFRVLLNLAKTHKRTYKIIKKLQPKSKVGLAHNCAYFYPGDDSIISKVVTRILNYVENDFFLNRVRKHQDYFGLNYYFANRVIGTRVHNPEDKVNDLGWPMQPDKLQSLLEQLYAKYKQPLMITESGVADSEDQYRKWWIAESIKAMNGAIKSGVKIIGYIHWSLLDNFEWAEGFWPRFGLVEIDYKTLQRKVRPSAMWYSRLIKTLHK